MTEQGQATSQTSQRDTICFAEMSGGVAVIRVLGRGSFSNSVELKQLADHLADQAGPANYHFIVDLEECITMDSTFMGVLASVGLRHRRENDKPMTLVRVNEQCNRLLKTLGVALFIDIHKASESPAQRVADSADLLQADQQEVSRIDRIIHMIEAHETLCDIDSQNIARFEPVIKYLKESLEREKQR